MIPSNSTLNLTTLTPIEKDELQKLKNIWQTLYDHNDSTQFRNPVDWESIMFLNYPSLRIARLSDHSKKAYGFEYSEL